MKTSHPHMDRVVSIMVLDHAFFSSILLKHPIVGDLTGDQTAMVNSEGRIRFNPTWFATLPVNEGVFVLAHEVLHYASRHALREAGREHDVWEQACDAWINETLNHAGIGSVVDGCIRRPGAHLKTEEQIYDEMMQERQKNKDKGKDSGEGGKGAGEGGNGNKPGKNDDGKGPPPKSRPDDPLSNDMESTPPEMSQPEQDRITADAKLDVANAVQAAKMRGQMPGVLQKWAADVIDSKVPWYDTLERWLTEKVKQDYSWARPNRRYMPDYYLPTLNSQGGMGELVVQVDVSGSVSPKELEYYNGHLKRIVELVRPAKTHVLYTDTRVQKHVEFDSSEEFGIEFYSGGGTNMCSGFEYCAQHGISPAVLVTLTDGFTPFPDEKGTHGIPSVWCISSRTITAPVGDSVHFDIHQ